MSPKRPRTAADLLVEGLEAEGCDWVFSVPGEETMDILDALSRSERVRHVTTRHEQGAAFMADVHGRLTGRSAVAMATLGPGATNLVTGHRRRLPRPRPDGRRDRPDRLRQAAQGSPSAGRHRGHARAGHEVEHARRAGRGHPGDRAQGVPRRLAREARADAHRAARGPRRRRPSPRTPDRWRRVGPTSPSRPTRPSPTPLDSSPTRSGRSSWPATACSGATPPTRCGRWPGASMCRSR